MCEKSNIEINNAKNIEILYNILIIIRKKWEVHNESIKIVISSKTPANQVATFVIIDTKLNVPVVTLSSNNNSKLLQQLQSGNWNNYQSKVSTKDQTNI